MSHAYYKHMVLIPDGVEAGIDFVHSLLVQKLSQRDDVNVVKAEDNRIRVERNGWAYHLVWAGESSVVEETVEIASNFAKNRDDQQIIASSKIRIDGYGDADLDMKFFNDYVRILTVLESISDVYHFQADDGEFWKSGEK